jgi:DNA-binding transcriptional ArsR family regulator
MGASKSEFFTEYQNEIADVARAFGHPARIAIIELLANTKGCICNDIVGVLPLAQPTISQHLKELKSAGVISGNIDGNAKCYCLNIKTLEKLTTFLKTTTEKYR